MSGAKSSREDIRRLYGAHGRLLLGYARALIGNVAGAEDAVHQVFARLLRGDLRINGSPGPYLCRAVRNAALNQRRARAREVEIGHAAWLEAPAGLEEIAMAIEEALDTLPVEQREVIVLHVWGGLTFAEVAGVLDVPANTAASRYRYGLAKLRRVLTPHGAAADES